MILQLFIFALGFIIFAVINFIRNKKILAWLFLILGIFAFAIGLVVVWLYPHTLPF